MVFRDRGMPALPSVVVGNKFSRARKCLMAVRMREHRQGQASESKTELPGMCADPRALGYDIAAGGGRRPGRNRRPEPREEEMARLQGSIPETFTAMDHIRTTTLENFDSLFTPKRAVWSLQNLQRFHALFVDQFDNGAGSFLEKFRTQLQEANEDILQLAAELLYVQQFFTSLTGPEKKDRECERSSRLVPPTLCLFPEWAVAGVRNGLAGDQSWNQHRPWHLAWLGAGI